MTSELPIFAARIREFIRICAEEFDAPLNAVSAEAADAEFNALALLLFALQCKANTTYRRVCESVNILPDQITHWRQIPAMSAAAFKDLEVTCLPPDQRRHVFHSSGTTGQKPSRHFHSDESLRVYETSLWPWFKHNLALSHIDWRLIALTPPPEQASNSSLVHMFDHVRHQLSAPQTSFVGRAGKDGTWSLDIRNAMGQLECSQRDCKPVLLLSTALSLLELLESLVAQERAFRLPSGSRVLETGGYKGRSRPIPRAELHAFITERLGVPASQIYSEYGMSELSSQAYRVAADFDCSQPEYCFRFPPWVRTQVISVETGKEVNYGEAGLVRVYDLANVYSVLGVQTEDLAIRRNEGFELLGRAQHAEPRGCSLMAAT